MGLVEVGVSGEVEVGVPGEGLVEVGVPGEVEVGG